MKHRRLQRTSGYLIEFIALISAGQLLVIARFSRSTSKGIAGVFCAFGYSSETGDSTGNAARRGNPKHVSPFTFVNKNKQHRTIWNDEPNDIHRQKKSSIFILSTQSLKNDSHDAETDNTTNATRTKTATDTSSLRERFQAILPNSLSVPNIATSSSLPPLGIISLKWESFSPSSMGHNRFWNSKLICYS
jgi:hypothetical protein